MRKPMPIRPREDILAYDRIRAYEDRKILDLLERAAKCPECVGDQPGGIVFGCGSCLEVLASQVMES
jgi:hypothetical protein